MIGNAVNINHDRGFFFIRVEVNQGTVDYFAHRSALRRLRIHEVTEGMPLQFEPTDTDKGPRAELIYPVGEEMDAQP